MDSMTADQLDQEHPLTEPGRLKRIAKGSGTRIEDVQGLLDEHKRLRVLITKVSKTNMGSETNQKLNLVRNPKQVLSKINSMIDPKTMAQLGGPANIMNLMKEMSNNPQMEEMMKELHTNPKRSGKRH